MFKAVILSLISLTSFLDHAAAECDSDSRANPSPKLVRSSCELAFKAAGCEQAAKTDDALKANLRDCAHEKNELRLAADTLLGCAEGAIGVTTDIFKAVAGGVASFYTVFANDSAARAKAVDACWTSTECRERVSQNANKPNLKSETRDDFQKTWLAAERRNTVDRVNLQREALGFQRDLILKGIRPNTPEYEAALKAAPAHIAAYQRKTTDPATHVATPLLDMVRAKASQLYQHTQCLNQEAATELMCYSIVSILAPNAAVGYLGKLARLERLLKARGALAEQSLGRPVSRSEARAVQAMHEIGEGEVGRDGTPAAIGNYTDQHLRDKVRGLKNKFTKEERRRLIEDGVVGMSTDASTATSLMKELGLFPAQLRPPQDVIDKLKQRLKICLPAKSKCPSLAVEIQGFITSAENRFAELTSRTSDLLARANAIDDDGLRKISDQLKNCKKVTKACVEALEQAASPLKLNKLEFSSVDLFKEAPHMVNDSLYKSAVQRKYREKLTDALDDARSTEGARNRKDRHDPALQRHGVNVDTSMKEIFGADYVNTTDIVRGPNESKANVKSRSKGQPYTAVFDPNEPYFTIQDRNGNLVHYDVDAQGKFIKMELPAGCYKNGKLKSINPCVRQTHFNYSTP